jgi:hypothetical protein
MPPVRSAWQSAPPSVHALLARLEDELGPPERAIEPDPGHAWVVLTTDHVVYATPDEPTRQRLATELRRREWARAQGLPQPVVVRAAEDHVVVERLPDDPPVGRRFVELAIDLCERIGRADPPPVEVLASSDDRRASRRTLPLRAARMARSPMRMTAFKAAQRAAFTLDTPVLAHGDFHPGNLLYDAIRERLVPIDWEFVGPGPLHGDLLTLWVHLREPEDRDALVRAVLRAGADRQDVGTLQRWFVQRHLADLVTSTRVPEWNQAEIDRACGLLDEAVSAAGPSA